MEIVMMGKVIAGIWMHRNVSLHLAVMILRDFARAQGCRGQTARPAIPWREKGQREKGAGRHSAFITPGMAVCTCLT